MVAGQTSMVFKTKWLLVLIFKLLQKTVAFSMNQMLVAKKVCTVVSKNQMMAAKSIVFSTYWVMHMLLI